VVARRQEAGLISGHRGAPRLTAAPGHGLDGDQLAGLRWVPVDEELRIRAVLDQAVADGWAAR
jgi:hypothetical protein